MVFHLSLSDSKSPHVSMTLLRILADLDNAVVWMDSARPPISDSFNFITKPLKIYNMDIHICTHTYIHTNGQLTTIHICKHTYTHTCIAFLRLTQWITKLCFNNTTTKVFYLQLWIWFVLGAARLVVFRLVGCLRRNGLAGCWDGSVLLDLWGMCSKSPCSFVSGFWRRVCDISMLSRAGLRSDRHSQFLGWHEVVPVEGMLNVSNLCSTGIPRKESIN